MSYTDAANHAKRASRHAQSAGASTKNQAFFNQEISQALTELAEAVSYMAEQQHRDN